MTTVKNVTSKVKCTYGEKTTKWIYSLAKSNKLHIDNERLQRLKKKWETKKVNSYLHTLFNGASMKDTIQLAKISTIIIQLEKDLHDCTDQYERVYLEENLEYFKSLGDKEYIVLDGQHRIHEIVEYFDGKTNFNPTSPVKLQIEGQYGDYSIHGKFNDLPDEFREYLLNEIPILVIIYETGDLKELVNIFITSNSMMAMTVHEKRILNYNPLNRWLTDLCNYDTNLKWMFSTVSSMSGDYHIDNKGDTLFVAEMLLWADDNLYENEVKRLDDVLGPVKSNIEYPKELSKKLTKDIFKLMADGCVVVGEKTVKKFSKSTLYNLFYTMAFIMQKGNHWGSQYNIDGKYKIVNPERFVSKFFDAEFERLKSNGTYTRHYDQNGKQIKKSMHEYSFAKHNADQKHKTKVSIKGEGGSKYDFNDYARLRYLLEDLKKYLTAFENEGIIKKVGSRDGTSRDELLVAHEVPLSESEGLHLDEIDPVSKGGERTFENTQFIDAKTNINMSNRTKRISGISS